MARTRVMAVVGARPNFVKIAPFLRALARRPDRFESQLVHTGQHYDPVLSTELLELPKPDVALGVGSGTHAEQVGRTLIALDPVLQSWKPDWLVVAGDVNATLAAALAAAKLHIRVAHIEAGLRSGDRTMPEEINRVVADHLASLLLTPDAFADENLQREGIAAAAIHRVGNIMIDSLEANREAAARLDVRQIVAQNCVNSRRVHAQDEFQGDYALLTLHRPSNVDQCETLAGLVECLAGHVAGQMPLVWVLHPRTQKHLEEFGLWEGLAGRKGVVLLSPVGYVSMLRLQSGARVILTDSGGLQEESCVLGVPCVTLRDSTERPITLTQHGGTAELAGNDPARVRRCFDAMAAHPVRPSRPPMWDGRTAERIVEVLSSLA